MNILKKLTIKDLKLNKKRTIGTLIGVILSTALITVVGGMFFTFQNTLVQDIINENGYYHIQLSDINENELTTVKNNKDFSHMETVYDLGYGIKELEDGYNYPVHFYSMTKETAEYLKYGVTEGRLPENDKEIVLPSTFSKKLKLKIGDTIQFNIGDLKKSEEEEESEVINSKDYEFKVVGITDRSGAFTTKAKSEKIDVYLTLQNPKNHEEDLSELLGIDVTKTSIGAKYEEFKINSDLLRWETFSFSDDTLKFLYAVVGVVIFIILVTSVFSIRNSFAISTTEKTRTYGMLASIGATRKQIKKMVLFEGVCLGLMGLPFGAVFGTFVTWLVTQIINYIALKGNLLQDGWEFYYKFSVIPVVIAFLVGIIIIYLSTIKCSIKASKTSPIQNIRNADNLSSKKIKLKVPKVIRKVFKIGGTISYKNLKRSKRKYRVTVVSLTISIFVFIIVSSLVGYGNTVLKENYSDLGYNVAISNFTKKNEIFSDENKVKELKNLEQKNYITYFMNNVEETGNYTLTDATHILYKDVLTEYIKDEETREKVEAVSTQIIIYDEDYMKEYAKQIGKKYEDIKDKAIIINRLRDRNIVDKKVYKDITDYKEGDEITLTNTTQNKDIKYKIGALTDIVPIGYSTDYMYSVFIVVSKEYFDEKVIPEFIYYDSKNADKLADTIEEKFPELQVTNIDEEVKAIKSMLLIFSIFIYGFIIVVTLIGVTSVFNTITSNMELRKKEFATLKSIGMTKKEFNNMIYLESFFYSFKSLFYGVILGTIGSYIVYQIFKEQVDTIYIFPKIPILIACVFVLLMVQAIMKYSIGKIERQNIIETIRKDTI